MGKNIKDYLHLYLGCEVDTNISGKYIHPYGCLTLKQLTADNIAIILRKLIDKEFDINHGYTDNVDFNCKPILRPLSDMTEEEKLHIAYNYAYPHVKFSTKQSALNNMDGRYKNWFTGYSDEFLFLLSKHFDLFGLIDAGLAIDKTTLK